MARHLSDDEVAFHAQRIAAVLDVTEKRLAIEQAYAELRPLVDSILDGAVPEEHIWVRHVVRAFDALGQVAGHPTVDPLKRGPRLPAQTQRDTAQDNSCSGA